MSRLLEHTRSLSLRINGLSQAQGGADEAKALINIRETVLQPRLGRLKTLIQARAALSQRGIAVAWPGNRPKLADDVKHLRQRLDEKPGRSTFVEANGWPAIERQLDPALAKADESTLTGWQAYCRAQAPAEKASDLRNDPVIGAHAKNASVLSRYDAFVQRLTQAQQRPPTDVQQIQEFDKNVQEARACLDELDRTPPTGGDVRIPAAVRQFLTATALDGGFRLSAFTAEIEDWLEEHGRLDEFEIRRKRV